MSVSEVTIECLGYELRGDYYDNNSDTLLFFLNGRTASRKTFGYMVGGLAEKTGYDAFLFDYSGHGVSEFDWKTISAGEHLVEVVKAFDLVSEIYPHKTTIVFGTSYGGYLATCLAQYRRFDSLVLAAPAIYPHHTMYDTAQKTHTKPGSDKSKNSYRNDFKNLLGDPVLVNASTKHDGPTLVVVHGDDEKIPLPTTDAYIECFSADSITIEDLPHSTEDHSVSEQTKQTYQDAIAEWLKR